MLLFGFVAFILAGLVLPLSWRALRDSIRAYDVRHRYKQTVCTVVSTKLGTEAATHLHGGHRHGAAEQVVLYTPQVRYTYSVAGRVYESSAFSAESRATEDRAAAETVLARYRAGAEYPCWYDPNRPEDAILERP